MTGISRIGPILTLFLLGMVWVGCGKQEEPAPPGAGIENASVSGMQTVTLKVDGMH